MINRYKYEKQLFETVVSELRRLSHWQNKQNITMMSKLEYYDVECLMSMLVTKFHLENEYYDEKKQKQYRYIVTRSFYKSPHMNTISKFIHVFEPMFRKFLPDIYPIPATPNKVIQKSNKLSVLINYSYANIVKNMKQH